jgi:hypothetical protein
MQAHAIQVLCRPVSFSPVGFADAIVYHMGVGPFAHWASKSCAAITVGLSGLSSCWVALLGFRPLLYARETESMEARIQVGFVLQLDVFETDGTVHAAVLAVLSVMRR